MRKSHLPVFLFPLEQRILASVVSNGDYNHDGRTDINDLAVIASGWQNPYNINDLTAVANNWQRGVWAVDPSDIGATQVVSVLYPTGSPKPEDVRQLNTRGFADCSPLADFLTVAQQEPRRITGMIKPDGNGGFIVAFPNATVDVSPWVPDIAIPSWASILEKAVAIGFGAGKYANLNNTSLSGTMLSVFGITLTLERNSTMPPDIVWNDLSTALNLHKEAGVTTPTSGTGLVASHAYSVVSVQTVGGIRYVTLRNPWGYDGPQGDGNDDGYVTVLFGDYLQWTLFTEIAK